MSDCRLDSPLDPHPNSLFCVPDSGVAQTYPYPIFELPFAYSDGCYRQEARGLVYL